MRHESQDARNLDDIVEDLDRPLLTPSSRPLQHDRDERGSFHRKCCNFAEVILISWADRSKPLCRRSVWRSGASLNRRSFSWPSVGICAFRFRTATSRNFSLSVGFSVDHVTVWRWVQRYAPECSGACAGTQTDERHLAGGRDLLRVKGQWRYFTGGGFLRRDARLPSLGQTGGSRGRTISRQSLGSREPSDTACNQHR